VKCCGKCSYVRQINGELCCVKNPPAADGESGIARWPIVQQGYYCGSFRSEEDKFSLEKSLSELPVEYDVFGPFCKIALTQGRYAKVDPEDFIRLCQFRWHCLSDSKTSYAVRTVWEDGKSHKIFMHRIVAQTPIGLVCDHINGCGLDNRKKNLRNCTIRQNNFNSRPSRFGRSRYKGVHYNKRAKKWVSAIKINSKRYYLGYFEDERAAALEYDEKARELFGRHAFLNFPGKKSPAMQGAK